MADMDRRGASNTKKLQRIIYLLIAVLTSMKPSRLQYSKCWIKTEEPYLGP